MMRCDLHVHSWYSGRADLPVLGHVGRECYSDPEDVYEAATRRGMHLVTLTDHDGIEGALRLVHRPNTFVSEEVRVFGWPAPAASVPPGLDPTLSGFDEAEAA